MIRNLPQYLCHKIFVATVAMISFASFAQSAAAFEFNIFKEKRQYLYIVGSSTVSPFMSSVAEEFNRNQSLNNPNFVAPVVESDGSTSGINIFCSGVGYQFPDFVNSSRVMHENELENCHRNNVKGIVEIKIGYDGIVLANSKNSKRISLTKEQIFLALAEKVYDKKSARIIENPYQYWNQIDASLPKTKILVFGPPLTSGTRDVFADIALEDVCFMKREFINALPDRDVRRKQCRKIRSDGHFIESGENDNLIVQNVKNNPDSLGIFGFNFLVANKNSIQPAAIDGVDPNFKTIASKKYELSRPLFVYFKKEHVKLMPQMSDFVKEIVDAETIGQNGYLVRTGLISLNQEEFAEIHRQTLEQLSEAK